MRGVVLGFGLVDWPLCGYFDYFCELVFRLLNVDILEGEYEGVMLLKVDIFDVEYEKI